MKRPGTRNRTIKIMIIRLTKANIAKGAMVAKVAKEIQLTLA